MNVLDWKKLLSRNKKRKPSDFIVIILIGVLFLILSIPTEKKETDEKTEQEKLAKEATDKDENQEEYLEESEKQLAEILESIEGVGKVKVMITLKNDGVNIVDKNKKESKETKEEETVIYDGNDETFPYVTSRQNPQIEGVLVVAQGGGNARVNSDISEAIMALFDVEVHKIKIVKMSE